MAILCDRLMFVAKFNRRTTMTDMLHSHVTLQQLTMTPVCTFSNMGRVIVNGILYIMIVSHLAC